MASACSARTKAATIENLALLNANVTGGSSLSAVDYGAGVLVGVAENSTQITGVAVTGTMTGSASACTVTCSNIGGIVGDLAGASTLRNSAAAVNVTSAISSAGGAVGAIETGGEVQNVSSTGNGERRRGPI